MASDLDTYIKTSMVVHRFDRDVMRTEPTLSLYPALLLNNFWLQFQARGQVIAYICNMSLYG